MLVVGLTGGLATGKSTVLEVFKQNGIAVIDADEIAKEVLSPGEPAWEEVRDYFGEEVLQPNGEINRMLLGQIVFDDVEKRSRLNSITHARIQSIMMKMVLSLLFSGHKYVVMEVPLLFESGNMLNFIYRIVTVTCTKEQQVERLCKRSGLPKAAALQRINCQMPLEEKVARSHYVIDNSREMGYTREQALRIVKIIKKSKFTWIVRGIVGVAILTILIGCFFLALQVSSIDFDLYNYNNSDV